MIRKVHQRIARNLLQKFLRNLIDNKQNGRRFRRDRRNDRQ